MKLIINGDDFGLSKGISDGIIKGIKDGYLTSTSIMINMNYANYAIQEAIKNDINCIGLHINLTVGKPIINNSNLTDENGVFYYNQQQIENKNLTYEDVYKEIIGQINKFKEYSDEKLIIDHLDTHHSIYANEIIRKVIIDISNEFDLPIRNFGNTENCKTPDIFYQDFSIKNVNIECIKSMVEMYKNQNLVIELLTHPGYIDDYIKSVTGYLGRENELRVLEECKKKGIFKDIELISFKELIEEY